MVIGYYSAKYSRYMLECRDSKGVCFYRKFTDEDRMNYLFDKIPNTTCGRRFRCEPIRDHDKNRPMVADPKTMTYISRELAKLQGKSLSPEQDFNQRLIANEARGSRVVHQTHSDRARMGVHHRLKDLPPAYEDDPANLHPVEDAREIHKAIAGEIPGMASFPAEEVAPEGFDMEAWLRGEAAPVLADAGPAPTQPQTVTAAGPSDEQFAVTGEKQTRSERHAAKKGG